MILMFCSSEVSDVGDLPKEYLSYREAIIKEREAQKKIDQEKENLAKGQCGAAEEKDEFQEAGSRGEVKANAVIDR